MGDKRFTDRIKRIEKRMRQGNSVELIAGVGAVKQAKAKAISAQKPGLSFFLILIGGLAGVFTFGFLRDRIGARLLTEDTSPGVLYAVFQDSVLADSWIAGAVAFVALSAVFTLTSFFRGRSSAKMMSFFGAAFGAIIGAGYLSI